MEPENGQEASAASSSVAEDAVSTGAPASGGDGPAPPRSGLLHEAPDGDKDKVESASALRQRVRPGKSISQSLWEIRKEYFQWKPLPWWAMLIIMICFFERIRFVYSSL